MKTFLLYNGGDMSYNTEIKVCLTSNTIRISKQLRIPYLQNKNIPFTIITTTKRALHMGQQKPRPCQETKNIPIKRNVIFEIWSYKCSLKTAELNLANEGYLHPQIYFLKSLDFCV